MRRAVAVVVGAIAVAVVASSSAQPAHPAQPSQPARVARLAVTGYQEESSPVSGIARSAATLTTVGVDGVNLTPSGQAVSTPDGAALRQLAAAHARQLPAILLIGNWSNAIGDFSEPLAHRMLSNPTAIAAVVSTLARVVAEQGWDGISVDLESLTARDRAGLTSFITSLRSALPAQAWLAIDIQNDGSAAAYAANGYDLHAIGVAVNELVLMGYDQHGPWENTPGPVGAVSWQLRGLRIVLRSVPAAKVTLGVAGYGYAWRPHANVMLSDAGARALVARDDATARYVRTVGEWTARLHDGSTLWWSDARSFRRRVALARAEHLHGLAVWSLGLSDTLRGGALTP
jgi:spore germination protein